MNKIFKVIKNKKALEAKKVVSELASANVASSDERASLESADTLADALKQFIKQSLCIAISSSLILQSSYADIVADANAPTNQQATILNTASGATQVNIQTPTAKGISVNQYSEFNTGENGTILNNSRVNVQTQSAGWVEGNPWLAGGEAKAIVNQVNSNDPSMLTGTIEVAGSRADVIIANPSGISVDGVSILNASGTTLTTGKVNMSGGAIESYSVDGGKITIEGAGLNDSSSDYTHIISRANEINANIHANDLKVVAGSNEVSADTSTITKKAASTPAPSVAIDTKALGGMYAGQITLVSTEEGVGVNNAGVVNANNFTLSADGKLVNSGTIAVNKKSDITVKTLENTNALTSNENIKITADTLNNSGTISALRELKSTTDALTNSGKIQAARLDITSDTLTNSGGTIAQAGSNSLNINVKKLTNTNGALLGSYEEEPLVTSESDTTTTDSGASVTTSESEVGSDTTSSTSDPLTPGSITVADELLNDGGEISGASVALGISDTLSNSDEALINVASLEHTGTLLDNENAKIIASGISALSLVSFTNAKSTIEGTELQFGATIFDNTEGSILGDAVGIEAQSVINQSGTIQSSGTLAVTTIGGSLDNTGGTLLSSGADVSMDIDGDVDNTDGTISAATTLDAKAYDISNDAGVMQADQFVNIKTTSLHNAGDILSGGDMSVSLENESTNEGTLSAAGDLVVETTAEFTNSAVMSAVGTLGFLGGSLTNSAEGEISGESVDVETDTLTNRGVINSNTLTWLKAGTLNNIGTGAIYGDTIIIDADTLLNTDETIEGVTKSAVIAARELLNIGAQNITNSEGSELLSLGALNIGGSIDEWGNVTGKATVLDNLSARIESDGDMYLGVDTINNLNTHLETMEVSDPTATEVFIQRLWGDYDWYPLSECYGITQGFEDNYCGINDKIARFQELGGVVHTNGVTYPGSSPFGSSSTLTPAEQAEVESLASQIRAVNFEDFYKLIKKSTTTHTELVSTDPAVISAGGNMLIDGKLYNKDSHVLAAGTIQTTQSPINEATKGQNVTAYDGSTINMRTVEGGDHDFVWHGATSYAIAPIINEVYDLATTLYEMNTVTQSVDDPREYDVSAVSLSDTEIRSISPNLALPTSSLFSINVDDPSALAPYIATDPRFTNYSEWLSSDYMISALGLDPTNIMKRLGDGYYELRLIKDQIAQLTGKRFLDGYGSDIEQYQALMDAGVTYAQAFGLTPGVALSAAQVAQLTSDMVWLVEEQVTLADGSTVTALVPKVYVVAKAGDLDGSGALLSGDNIVVSGTDELINSGTIYGRNVVSLSSQSSISNLGGKIEANTVALYASADINNIGGSLDAQAGMLLDAGGDINIASETYETSTAEGQSNFSRTGIKSVATLYVDDADGLLLMNAGNDVNLVAADIQNQGALTQISAGNNVNIASVTVAEQNNAVWDSQNRYKKGYTNEIGSGIHTTGDITVVAGNDVNVKASTVESESGTVGIGAENDINIVSGVDTTNYDEAYYYKRKTLGGSKSTTDKKIENTSSVVASNIGGDQVILDSGHDVTIKGSNIVGDSAVSMNAANDITITSAEESTYTSSYYKKTRSGFFAQYAEGVASVGYKNSKNTMQNSAQETTQIASNIVALNGDTTIQAGNNLKIKASNIGAGENINLSAKDIEMLAAQNTYSEQYSQESKSKGFSIGTTLSPVEAAESAYENSKANDASSGGGFMNKFSREFEASNAALGAISTPVVMTAHNQKSSSQGSYSLSSAQVSSLEAGGDINIIATDGSIYSEGTLISAEGDALLLAKDNIDLDVAHTTEALSSKSKASGFTFDNRASANTPMDVMGVYKNKGNGVAYTDTITGTQISVGGITTIGTTEGDITLTGANVVSTGAVNITAANDLTIQSAQDLRNNANNSDNRAIGKVVISATERFSGYHNEKHEDDSIDVMQVSSNVASLENSVNLSAGNAYTQRASNVMAAGDVDITAKTIDITTADNTGMMHSKDSSLMIGSFARINSPIIDLINNVDAASKSDGRLQAMQGMAAVANGYQIASAASSLAGGAGSGSLISAEVGVGFSTTSNKENAHYNIAQGSAISAGNNVNITSTEGDITATGANIKAGDTLSLDSARDIILQAATNEDNFRAKRSNYGLEVGVGVSVGAQTGIYVYVALQAGKGKTEYDATTHDNTHLSADTINLTSKEDTTLKGAVAQANTINADVGGDLTIESLQDEIRSVDKDSGMNLRVQISIGTAWGASGGDSSKTTYGISGGGNFSHANGTYAGVNEQSGLYAGEGGYHITVGGNTDLKGGAIASTNSENSELTTNTLTFSDIINHSEYEASSVSLSGGYNITNETPSFSASPPIQEDGEDTTTTYATLTEGNINVGGTRSNASDLGIHTDIDTAHEKVEDLPDLKAILEEQKAMAAAANTVIETSGQIASDIAKAAAKAKAEAKAQAEKDALGSDRAWEYFIALEKEDTATQEAILREVNAEYNEAATTLEHWGVGGDYSRALSVVTNIIVGATSGQGNAQLATNAIAPYASQLIGDTFEHTDDPNKAAQLLSHAVLGAIIAYMNGGDAVSGAASATASELASMVLAKELYPEAFDENGNLVRSDLSEEQAESIVAITNAIGAITGGITGGDAVNASLGSFIGENAVVNNKLKFEAEEELDKYIKMGMVNLTVAHMQEGEDGWFVVDSEKAALYAALGDDADKDDFLINVLLDFTPIVGDAKGFAEAETKGDYFFAVLALIPGIGDSAKASYDAYKTAKAAGDVKGMQKAINEAKTDITLFRGGNKTTVRVDRDIEVKNGLVDTLNSKGKPQGLSVNLDPNDKFVQNFGGAFPVNSLPDGLVAIQSGSTGHYVIAPAKPMTLDAYQQLLNKIDLGSFNKLP